MKKTAILAISALFLLTGCGNKENKNVGEISLTGLTTEKISPVTVDSYYKTSGTVKSTDTSVISPIIMGKVTSVRVKEGDKVSKGQLLLTIDSRDISQKLAGALAGIGEAEKAAQAEAKNLAMQTKTYNRYSGLYDDKAISKQEFDTIKTGKDVAKLNYERAMLSVQRARAGYNELKVYQSYAAITSPISGVVSQKNIDTGSTAIPGQPVLVITSNGTNEINADIAENLLSEIKVGTSATIESDGKTYASKITAVVPTVDPVSRKFKVKLASAGLISGNYTTVKIPVAKKQTMLVSTEAVVQKGELTGVYVVDKDKILSYRLVKTGEIYGNKTEILSGLDYGETIVVKGAEKAVDGGKIE